MPSFDVVSELNAHEVSNAVDQASRELQQRFDFKDAGATFALEGFTVTMKAQVDFQLKQMLEILKIRLAKRGVDVTCIELKDPETNVAEARQQVILRHGIDQDAGRKIVKLLKESRMKIQAAIQGDKVRVTGKSRDDLQTAIALIRNGKLELPLQFENFRD